MGRVHFHQTTASQDGDVDQGFYAEMKIVPENLVFWASSENEDHHP